MDTNFYQGKLKRWNDDKGFGFIESENGKGDIFIHISSLKQMSRRPMVGDVIHYQVHTDNNAKNRAVNAKIEGVSEAHPREKRNIVKNKDGYGLLSKIVALIFLALAGSVVYNKLVERSTFIESPVAVTSSPLQQSSYSCSGKVYCSEMTSCEEAKFYLNNCPGTEMDGDGDGIPCESQWCGW